jgi:hypothetical protein
MLIHHFEPFFPYEFFPDFVVLLALLLHSDIAATIYKKGRGQIKRGKV